MAVAECIFLLFRNIFYIFIFRIFEREAGVAEIYHGKEGLNSQH